MILLLVLLVIVFLITLFLSFVVVSIKPSRKECIRCGRKIESNISECPYCKHKFNVEEK